MPRREIVTIKDLIKRRATAWEIHYQNRKAVQQLMAQVEVTLYVNAIHRNVPPPQIETDGYLYRPLPVICGEATAAQQLGIPQINKHLLCLWYWTQTGWDDFVRLYQGLPEITEDHYLMYDSENDIGILVPLSSKPVRADAKYNLGTTQVQPTDLYLDVEQ